MTGGARKIRKDFYTFAKISGCILFLIGKNRCIFSWFSNCRIINSSFGPKEIIITRIFFQIVAVVLCNNFFFFVNDRRGEKNSEGFLRVRRDIGERCGANGQRKEGVEYTRTKREWGTLVCL